VKKREFLRVCAASAFLAGISGCGVVPLSPDRPDIQADRNDVSETSELVVIISGDSLGYKAGWVVYVDGVARAWLPTRPVFTRIPVTPGAHEVTVAFRTRDLNIIVIPLPPSSNEVKGKTSLSCTERARCAVKARIYVDRKTSYLVVDQAAIGEKSVDDEIRTLSYVAPGG